MTRDDVDLGREMAAAAKAATEASLAAGYSRSDKVTKDSARRAAEEVYLRARGHHDGAVPRVIDQPKRDEDTWQERADLA